MKKKLSLLILCCLSFSALASGHHVVSDVIRAEENLSFDHRLIKYNLVVDKKYPFRFNIRTDFLYIDMNDLIYKRDFDLNEVYRIPSFKSSIERKISSYESSNDVKINFSISHASGFRFDTVAASQRIADKAAKDMREFVEEETSRIAKDNFHHIAIGSDHFFDYPFASKSQSSLGEEIYRKTRPIVSQIPNPLNRVQFYLDLVQNIPYDNEKLGGHYFRTPLAVIMDNKGDCDEKSLLLLTILKEAFPDKKVALLALKNIPHAIALIESLRPMDQSFRYKGVNYLPLETTASVPYGKIDEDVKNEIKKGQFFLFQI